MKKLLAAALLLLFALCAQCALGEETARDITAECVITSSAGHVNAMTDGNYATYWKFDVAHTITVELPEGEAPGGVYLEWFWEDAEYTVSQYGADGELLKEQTEQDFIRGIETWHPLEPQTRRVKFLIEGGGRVCEIHVYGGGALPPQVHPWQAPPETADVLLFVAHQDDEELWFGGLLPYYGPVRDETVQVVYMTSCNRFRRAEALNGLWAMGLTEYPEFINFEDRAIGRKAAIENWGGESNILDRMVSAIRRYKPAVIVTHDVNGEYGHIQHVLTAHYLPQAVRVAAGTAYTRSYNLYGSWQTQKLYNHLGEENVIYMDWNEPSEKLGGRTPLQAACDGFACHLTQLDRYSMDIDPRYDNSKFSLAYSLVGEDAEKNDFLENIDLAALRGR